MAGAPDPTPAAPAVGGGAADDASTAGRQELLRALGAVVLSPPPQCEAAAESLGLPAPSAAEHTGVFVLGAAPHAAIYLGEEGKLGGEGADRVAGFWRVLGLDPPPDSDHLGTLLILAAELGDAVAAASSPSAAAALAQARSTLIWEHLWSWAPAYLSAVARMDTPALGPWARLTLAALAREARLAAPPAELPLAFRAAPPHPRAQWASAHPESDPAGGGEADGGAGTAESPAAGLDEGSLLDALLAPVRSGILLTRDDLREAAEAVGVGYRVGERRYTLASMFGQDAAATLGWLSGFALRWRDWHLAAPPAMDAGASAADPRRWWAQRAEETALLLEELQRELVATG